MPGFVIQGGDPKGDGTGGPGYTIPDETVVGEYGRGIVAMARTSQPDSQGSQFFIVLDDGARDALEQFRTYVIFGNVVSGMDVVDEIAAMPNCGRSGRHGARPGRDGVRDHPGAQFAIDRRARRNRSRRPRVALWSGAGEVLSVALR